MLKCRITAINEEDAFSTDPVVGLVGTAYVIEPSNMEINTEGWVACSFVIDGPSPLQDEAAELYFFAVKLEEVTE